LLYAVENQGKQILNFGLGPEAEELNLSYEWSVINNNISLPEGKDWSFSHDGTIIVNDVSGEVIIKRYTFGDLFGNGEAYANLPFHQQHSVGIIIGAVLAIVIIVAVLVKVKTRDQP
jgi:hypothetical protein